MYTILVSIALCGQLSNGEVSHAQFIQLIKSQHEIIKDITFIYEGEHKLVGPKSVVEEEGGKHDLSYQGYYAFRRDGATYMDLYRTQFEDDALLRSTWALINHDFEMFDRPADAKHPAYGTVKKKGGAGSFYRPCTPERFILPWFYYLVDRIAEERYKFIGWENVNGQKCLLIEMAKRAAAKNQTAIFERYWFDMERGGRILKYELWQGGQLRVRTDGIALRKCRTEDGKDAWFPVAGVNSTFVWERQTYDSPVLQETFKLVTGTLRINRGIPDEQFSVRWKGETPPSEKFDRARKEFGDTLPFRADPAGVRERLDRVFEKAQKQSQELMASGSEAGYFWQTSLPSMMLSGFGVFLLTGVLLLRRRQ